MEKKNTVLEKEVNMDAPKNSGANEKMNKKRLANKIPLKRRLIQLYAALLTNANIKGFVNGKIYQGPVKNVCYPGLNCYSCPGAGASCPLGALQNALTDSGKTIPYYVFGIIMLYGILFGRWICGFLCPFGLIQDLLYKIKTPKMKKNRVTKVLSYLKYVILVVFVFILPITYMLWDMPLPGFCKYFCPAGTLGGAIGLLINPTNTELFGQLGPLFTWKFALLVGCIIAVIFIYRAFCRFVCPLGALYGLFNRFAIFGIKLHKDKCIDCGLCVSKCKMDIKHVGDHECINCGECISVCPTKAIQWKGNKIILPENDFTVPTHNANGELLSEDEFIIENAKMEEKKDKRLFTFKLIASILMVITLGSALVYYNFIDVEKEPCVVHTDVNGDKVCEECGENFINACTKHIDTNGDMLCETCGGFYIGPVEGTEVGNICIGFDMEKIVGDGSFNIKNNTGKVTVINFWYTDCTACRNELPHFDALAKKYGSAVEVVAVHATDDDLINAGNLVNSVYPDYSFTWVADGEGDYYYYALGGSGAWPITVIVNGEGIITHKIMRSVTEAELEAAILEAMGNS